MARRKPVQRSEPRSLQPGLKEQESLTRCRSFDWKFIRQVRAPAKQEMSRCPPKETRLVIFRFPDVAARYSQQPQEDMGFQETFPDKVCWGMEMAPKLP